LLITGWVDGRVWNPDDLQQPAQLHRLGSRLAALHYSGLALPVVDLENAIEVYAGAAACGAAETLRRDAMAALAGLDLCHDRLRPGHNDLGCNNILEKQELMFIDWEYGGLCDPLFDLAGIVHQNNLSTAATRNILAGYGRGLAEGEHFWQRFEGFRRLYGLIAELWLLAARAGSPQ
jgi:aminoglycoside phosphotransferase (APT) family kinase protein